MSTAKLARNPLRSASFLLSESFSNFFSVSADVSPAFLSWRASWNCHEGLEVTLLDRFGIYLSSSHILTHWMLNKFMLSFCSCNFTYRKSKSLQRNSNWRGMYDASNNNIATAYFQLTSHIVWKFFHYSVIQMWPDFCILQVFLSNGDLKSWPLCILVCERVGQFLSDPDVARWVWKCAHRDI